MGTFRTTVQDLFDEYDIARITRRSVASVRRDRLWKKGCPYIKIGASVRYRPSDVEAWLTSLPRCSSQERQG